MGRAPRPRPRTQRFFDFFVISASSFLPKGRSVRRARRAAMEVELLRGDQPLDGWPLLRRCKGQRSDQVRITPVAGKPYHRSVEDVVTTIAERLEAYLAKIEPYQ